MRKPRNRRRVGTQSNAQARTLERRQVGLFGQQRVGVVGHPNGLGTVFARWARGLCEHQRLPRVRKSHRHVALL